MTKKNKDEELIKELEEPMEKSIEENLRDDIYFRYNVLLSLEELKQINLSLLQVMRVFVESMLREEESQPEEREEKKEEREGTFR